MSILITGITGRIGANLARALVERGHPVRGLVWPRDPRVDKLNGLGVELVSGSLTNAGEGTGGYAGHQDGCITWARPFRAADPFPKPTISKSTYAARSTCSKPPERRTRRRGSFSRARTPFTKSTFRGDLPNRSGKTGHRGAAADGTRCPNRSAKNSVPDTGSPASCPWSCSGSAWSSARARFWTFPNSD